MTVNLRDVIPDRSLLMSMLDQGYIRMQKHPTEPLQIFNYTEKCVFDRAWNKATLNCRGLILNTNTYEVEARAFSKFFNYNEPDAPVIEPDVPVWVTDKVDGSLGIRYWQPKAKKWAIATRGSFTSEQALHATAKLDEFYGGVHEKPDADDREFTQLYEIVYPGNRIVIDYGNRDELVFLGMVHKRNGTVMCPPEVTVTGLRNARVFVAATYGDALKLPPRENAEGVVITTRTDSCQVMVKMKQDDYIKLHKTLSHLNDRTIWERLSEGDLPSDIRQGLPEEFWPYIEETSYRLLTQHAEMCARAKSLHRFIISNMEVHRSPANPWTRKDYAAAAVQFPERDLLFLLLDGKSIKDVVWRKIRPSAANGPMSGQSEDNA